MAAVVDEHGSIAGIVTVEELVGEIYDETDRDVIGVNREPDGALLLPGRFPIHDLVDIGITEVPAGTTPRLQASCCNISGASQSDPASPSMSASGASR